MLLRGLPYLVVRLMHLLFRWVNLLVNYSIYYFGRLVLRQSDQQHFATSFSVMIFFENGTVTRKVEYY